jgi:hypothetical protein
VDRLDEQEELVMADDPTRLPERDMETNPYSSDELRVAEWLVAKTGAGDDPIGFVMASLEYSVMQRNQAWAALKVVREACGQNNCNCPGASRVRAALDDLNDG